MEPIILFSVVGGILALLLYSYGIVMVASMVTQRQMIRDHLVIAMHLRNSEDVDWDQFDELDENGEVVAHRFELITNDELNEKRDQKQKDNEDE